MGLIERYFEDLGEALLKPRELALVFVAERRGIGSALVTVIFMGFLYGLAFSTPIHAVKEWFSTISWIGIVPLVSGIMIFVSILALLVLWVLYGSLSYLFVRLVGGKGDFTSSLSMVGISFIGLWPSIVVPLLAAVFSPSIGMIIGSIPVGLLIGILWMHYSIVSGLSEIHGITPLKVALAIVLLVLVIAGLILLPTMITGINVSMNHL